LEYSKVEGQHQQDEEVKCDYDLEFGGGKPQPEDLHGDLSGLRLAVVFKPRSRSRETSGELVCPKTHDFGYEVLKRPFSRELLRAPVMFAAERASITALSLPSPSYPQDHQPCLRMT